MDEMELPQMTDQQRATLQRLRLQAEWFMGFWDRQAAKAMAPATRPRS